MNYKCKELIAENKAFHQANIDCNAHFDTLKEDYEELKTENEELTQTKNAYKLKYIALQNENKELKAQVPKWISVKDRLPKEGTWCIVYHEGEIDSDHYTIFAFNKKYDFALYGNKVSHWMPLPPPPTTDESSEKENR